MRARTRRRSSSSRRPARPGGAPPRPRSRSGTRSRRSRSPSPRTKKNQLEDLRKKLQKMAEQMKEKDWSNTGIRKQAEWVIQIRDYNEELHSRLQAEFGEFSGSLNEFVKAGEKLVHDRIHLLRIADKFGWAGANDFMEEELARDEKEERNLKVIRKEFEAKREKKGQGSDKGKSNFLYKKQVENYKDTRYDIEFFCEEAGDHHDSSGSKISKVRRIVSSVIGPAILLGTAAAGVMTGSEEAEIRSQEEEDEAAEALEEEEAPENFSLSANTMKYSNRIVSLHCDQTDNERRPWREIQSRNYDQKHRERSSTEKSDQSFRSSSTEPDSNSPKRHRRSRSDSTDSDKKNQRNRHRSDSSEISLSSDSNPKNPSDSSPKNQSDSNPKNHRNRHRSNSSEISLSSDSNSKNHRKILAKGQLN